MLHLKSKRFSIPVSYQMISGQNPQSVDMSKVFKEYLEELFHDTLLSPYD